MNLAFDMSNHIVKRFIKRRKRSLLAIFGARRSTLPRLYYSEIDLSCMHWVFRRYARSVRIPDEDTIRGSQLFHEVHDVKRKETKAGYTDCITQCLSSQLSMLELRSKHFTFIRVDARETPLIYLSIPA